MGVAHMKGIISQNNSIFITQHQGPIRVHRKARRKSILKLFSCPAFQTALCRFTENRLDGKGKHSFATNVANELQPLRQLAHKRPLRNSVINWQQELFLSVFGNLLSFVWNWNGNLREVLKARLTSPNRI